MVGAKTIWRIVGDEIASCNCDWGCPCQFNALPTHGRCEGMGGHEIREGHYGSVRLDGVRFVELYWFPGAVHEGNGTHQLIFDSSTTSEQRDALKAITWGLEGGMPFEIFSAVCPNKFEPIIAAITFECDRERRTARISVTGVGELDVQPIKNPVTGEEHRARIVLPDGFEFKEADMANAVRLNVKSNPPLVFDHLGTYAQLNAFDWTNA